MGKKKDAKRAARAAAAQAAENHTAKAATGFVVPDELRRVGELLIAKANSPQGREMIASGLALAATAAAASAGRQRQQSRHAGEQAPVPPVPSASPVTPNAPPNPGVGGTQPIDPQAVADAIGDAAGALLTRLFGAKRP